MSITKLINLFIHIKKTLGTNSLLILFVIVLSQKSFAQENKEFLEARTGFQRVTDSQERLFNKTQRSPIQFYSRFKEFCREKRAFSRQFEQDYSEDQGEEAGSRSEEKLRRPNFEKLTGVEVQFDENGKTLAAVGELGTTVWAAQPGDADRFRDTRSLSNLHLNRKRKSKSVSDHNIEPLFPRLLNPDFDGIRENGKSLGIDVYGDLTFRDGGWYLSYRHHEKALNDRGKFLNLSAKPSVAEFEFSGPIASSIQITEKLEDGAYKLFILARKSSETDVLVSINRIYVKRDEQNGRKNRKFKFIKDEVLDEVLIPSPYPTSVSNSISTTLKNSRNGPYLGISYLNSKTGSDTEDEDENEDENEDTESEEGGPFVTTNYVGTSQYKILTEEVSKAPRLRVEKIAEKSRYRQELSENESTMLTFESLQEALGKSRNDLQENLQEKLFLGFSRSDYRDGAFDSTGRFLSVFFVNSSEDKSTHLEMRTMDLKTGEITSRRDYSAAVQEIKNYYSNVMQIHEKKKCENRQEEEEGLATEINEAAFPNPVVDTVQVRLLNRSSSTVENALMTQVKVEFFDLNEKGKKVSEYDTKLIRNQNYKLLEFENPLNVSDLSKGLYLMRISSGLSVWQFKIVKK